jgi:hypothetical protein
MSMHWLAVCCAHTLLWGFMQAFQAEVFFRNIIFDGPRSKKQRPLPLAVHLQ